MTEKIKCICKYKSKGNIKTEEIMLDRNNYGIEYNNMIREFNRVEIDRNKDNTSYPMDIRTFVSIKATEEFRYYCRLDKKNFMTINGKKGYYDLLECHRCKRQYKRYTLDTPQDFICNPDLVCQKCHKVFKTENGIRNHIIRNKCKQL